MTPKLITPASIATFIAWLSAAAFFACQRKDNVGRPTETPNAMSLVFQENFADRVIAVQKDKLGNFWIGRTYRSNPDARPSSFLEHRRTNGEPLHMQLELGEGIFSGLAALDNGHLIVALLVDGTYLGTDYGLKLISIDAEGKITGEKKFEDFDFEPPVGFDCKLPNYTRFGFYGQRSVAIASHGDRFALLNYNCQYSRLSMITKSFGVVWTKEISTQRSDAFLFYQWENISVTPGGTIVTAAGIHPNDIASYNSRFIADLNEIGESDVLVSAFDPEGKRLFSKIVGTKKNDTPTAITSSNDLIVTGGDCLVNRATSVKDSQDDICLAGLNAKDGQLLWSRTIDIQDEDTINTLSIVGNKYLAVGGSTARLQVPTGSIVRHGDAFLLLTDLSGNSLGKKIFGTQRDDSVETITDIDGAKILVGGGKDGPITHDGDLDKTQLHSFGFLDSIAVDEIIGKQIR